MCFKFSLLSLRLIKQENMEIKERIIQQAGELFVKHGIKRISMDEIASKLGIKKGRNGGACVSKNN